MNANESVCDWCGLREKHLAYRKRIVDFVMNHVEEVTNEIGGVIDYKLNLNAAETECLLAEIERK